MGTEKFEDKIKRQLQDREITPSAGSWNKLSARLDETQQKKNPFVLWMGIAASIIGGVLILSLVFNNANFADSPELVDTPKEESILEKTPEETSEEIFIQTQDEEEQLATTEVEEVKKETIAPILKRKVNQEKYSAQNNREALAVMDNSDLINDKAIIAPSILSEDKMLELKLSDALSNVIANVENGQTVTDAEVNRLLTEAAARISREQYKTDFAVGKVNAQDLLRDVEFELDNSFRDKIFDMLKEGYSKARTAVANRNY